MPRCALTLAGLLLVSGLYGCAAAVVGGVAPVGTPAQHDRSAGEVARDADIASAINARYVRDDLISAFDVRVAAYRGVVTLSGRVRSRQAEQRAIELARSVQGVRQVVSKLVIASR